ncbi:MAG TPA: SPOR domain-containing protein [Casimicrobiaceae bacterium]|jgi:DedD protein
MAEPADINVDELRRRARRRLVGAIVLALGAAVIVPILLESDPKPLGDDVSVKIPPIDDGKFVNRLNEPPSKPESSKAEPAKDVRKESPPQPDAAARKSVTEAEKAVIAPPAKTPKYDTTIPSEKMATASPPLSAARAPMAPPVAAESPPPAPSTPTETKTPAVASAQPESKAVVASAVPAIPSAQSAREGFAVQLAAYSDDKGANALASRLKRSGYPAYTEPLKTSRGTLWRVRVGPYPSRDAATGVRDKLKAEGQSGIVASAK